MCVCVCVCVGDTQHAVHTRGLCDFPFKQVRSHTETSLENVFRVVSRDTGGTEVHSAQWLGHLTTSYKPAKSKSLQAARS